MMVNSRNQSLIVSGESGAGKTEACKRVMTYLTAISRARSDELTDRKGVSRRASVGVENVEEKVLRCNPFLEAFGNAKTNRNDNSSRFGKFLRLEYIEGRIVGANMKHYLLEKSRIVEPGPGERSYHIFYQLVRGATSDQRREMGDLPSDIDHYNYLNKSGCDSVPNVDDVAEFKEVIEALRIVGVTDEEMTDVWAALSAVMSLGNVMFDGGDEYGDDEDAEASISHDSEETIEHVARMLGTEEVGTWIRQRQVGGGRSSVVIKVMNVMNATDARDALAKAIYSKIFDWLVKKVNKSLFVQQSNGETTEGYIGILDIFGFEIFEENSFEQLCINFCNEKLQMLFNEHVFTLEANIYKDEGINVSAIEVSPPPPHHTHTHTHTPHTYTLCHSLHTFARLSHRFFISMSFLTPQLPLSLTTPHTNPSSETTRIASCLSNKNLSGFSPSWTTCTAEVRAAALMTTFSKSLTPNILGKRLSKSTQAHRLST